MIQNIQDSKDVMYLAATAGPFSKAETWVTTEAQAAAGIIIVIAGVVMLAKRKASDLIQWLLIGGGALVIIFSPDSLRTWLISTIKTIFGIA